jgi:hypothetical protein
MFQTVIKPIVRKQVWVIKKKTVAQVLTPRCRRDGEPEYGRFGDVNFQYVVNTSGYYRLKRRLIAGKAKKPKERMGMFLRDMLKFPYGKPGYEAELYEEANGFRMNLYSCPLYDFYKQFGEEELTLFRKVFCTYDYAAAERLVDGGRYQRERTLSDGDEVCATRWFVVEASSS